MNPGFLRIEVGGRAINIYSCCRSEYSYPDVANSIKSNVEVGHRRLLGVRMAPSIYEVCKGDVDIALGPSWLYLRGWSRISANKCRNLDWQNAPQVHLNDYTAVEAVFNYLTISLLNKRWNFAILKVVYVANFRRLMPTSEKNANLQRPLESP